MKFSNKKKSLKIRKGDGFVTGLSSGNIVLKFGADIGHDNRHHVIDRNRRSGFAIPLILSRKLEIEESPCLVWKKAVLS